MTKGILTAKGFLSKLSQKRTFSVNEFYYVTWIIGKSRPTVNPLG